MIKLIKDMFKVHPKTGDIIFADNYEDFYEKWDWKKSSKFSHLIGAFRNTYSTYGIETMKAIGTKSNPAHRSFQ